MLHDSPLRLARDDACIYGASNPSVYSILNVLLCTNSSRSLLAAGRIAETVAPNIRQ